MTDVQVAEATIRFNKGDVDSVLGRSHKARIVAKRRALAHALKAAGWSAVRIGKAIGRDSSTVLNLLGTKPSAKWSVPATDAESVSDSVVSAEVGGALCIAVPDDDWQAPGWLTTAPVKLPEDIESEFETAAVKRANRLEDPRKCGVIGVDVSVCGETRKYAMRSVERFGKRCWEISTRVD